MATVTGYTAARTKQIEDSTIVGGTVDQATKHLLLQARDGSTVDAGKIDGPKGDKGDPGLGNVNTVNGKFGPDVVLTPADVGALPATTQASESVFGSTRLATNAEALAGTSDSRTVTPKKLITVAQDRWERTGSTLLALGTGKFAGQIALLTLASDTFPVEVVWTGARWEPVSWRLSGTQAQRDAFEASGVCFDGVEWYNSTTQSASQRINGLWATNTPGLNALDTFTLSSVTPTATFENHTDNTIDFANGTNIRFQNLFDNPFYTSFRVHLIVTGVSSTNTQLQMCYINASGVNVINQYYQNGRGYQWTPAGERSWYQSNSISHLIQNASPGGSGYGFNIIDIMRPGIPGRTMMSNRGLGYNSSSVIWESIDTIGMLDNHGIMTGFLITTNDVNKTFSARISVYGYN